MKFSDHVACWWYGLEARADAIWHLVRGHKLHWRIRATQWTGCSGDIVCEKCPDMPDGANVAIWCRYSHVRLRIAQFVCGLQGHREFVHPKRWNGAGDPSDEWQMIECTDEWMCSRCMASRDTSPRSVDG